MNREQWSIGGIFVAMLAVGTLAWWFELRPELEVDAGALEALPLELGEWRGEVLPIGSGVERILEADLNLQRGYRAPDEELPVWLYVGYYGTARGGHPEHTPQVCYPSAGWEIEFEQQLEIDGLGPVNELVVSQDGHTRLAHFWYDSYRSQAMLGRFEVSLDHLKGRLSDGRADGALVRLSTPIVGDDFEGARARLLAFRAALGAELAVRWPIEIAAR